MGRKYSLDKLERLMKEENNNCLSYRDAKRWREKQKQKQERCNSCRSNNVPCKDRYSMVACSSPTCYDSGERCSREDDELFYRIRHWRRVKRAHFDEIAKKLPKSRGIAFGTEETTKLLTPWFKSHLDLEDDEDDDEEEESLLSDDDSGLQSEEATAHTMADDDDGDESEIETDSDNAPSPSKRKRRRNSDDDSEYEEKPPSKKELQATILSLRTTLRDKAKQSADELRKLKIENQKLSDRRQRKYQSKISKLEADMEEMKRDNAASKEHDRRLIQKWEKQANVMSATLDELRLEHAKLQETYAHDKNETGRGSSTSQPVSQAPPDENTTQEDVPMPASLKSRSELQEEIRTLKEKQEADAITETELRQSLHWREETSALKEADLRREIQALNAMREVSVVTETELRREVQALIAKQEEIGELMTRQEASTAARETELRQELQSLSVGLESANVSERNLRSELVKVKEDQQRQSKDEHYELSTVLQSLRRGIPRPDLADVVQMQISIIERLVDRRVLLNLPEMDTSD